MKVLQFYEATPLIDFIEQHRSDIIGHTLTELFTFFWPYRNRRVMSDEPIIFKLDNCFLVVNYLIYSDMEIVVCSEEELENDRTCAHLLHIKNEVCNYYDDEFGDGEKKDQIEGRTIVGIAVERFSEAFEYNTAGDMRPAGGDYFSTIRLHLDSGKTLCFCGCDSITDGYNEIWCE